MAVKKDGIVWQVVVVLCYEGEVVESFAAIWDDIAEDCPAAFRLAPEHCARVIQILSKGLHSMGSAVPLLRSKARL